MAVINVRFRSPALARHSSFNVIYPEVGEGPYPVLLQLHGYSDDAYSWLYNSRIVQHVARYPLIVVLPDGSTSGYLDLKGHERRGIQYYESHIIEDVLGEVRRTFQVRSGPMAIGGLSMGGYGSLRLGMKYPDLFSSIWAHSAGLRAIEETAREVVVDPKDAEPLTHAREIKARSDRGEPTPEISMDCGTEDFLIENNREFHAALNEMGLEHHYAEHPGAHTWDYWDQHVQEALVQHARVLGIQPVIDDGPGGPPAGPSRPISTRR